MRIRTATLLLSSALVSLGLQSACSTGGNFNLGEAVNCYRPGLVVNDANADQIARSCAQAAQETWPSVSAITNAAFHAGVAERLVGERYNSAGDTSVASTHFEAAATLLERAVSLAPETTSGRPRPPAKADGMLELARVRYDQRSYGAALAQLDALLRVEEDSESDVHASAHYLRGLTLHDSGQPLSALTDWGVFVDDALDRHADATAARTRLIAVATRLGVEALARNTRADAQTATELFGRARDAAEASEWNGLAWPIRYGDAGQAGAVEAERCADGLGYCVDQAGIFINIGRARLDMAGLTSPQGFADFSCAPNTATVDHLNLARADFASATERGPRNDRAWRLLSCAELSLGRIDQAARTAARSTEFAPPTGSERGDDYRMLGRARAQLAPPTGAAEAFEEARQHPSGNPWLSRVLTELAAVYESQNQSGRARERLLDAVAADPGYSRAFLRLGVNYFDGDLFAEADAKLRDADRLTDPQFTTHETAAHEHDRAVRAETLYYLSRLRIEWPGHSDGQAAIRFADEAFRLDGSVLNRAQACLARVWTGSVGLSTPAQGYCSAMGQAAPVADSYLYEGVYHLRRAQYLRGGDHDRALESAYRSFSDGLRLLPSGSDRVLQAKLLQGQAIAQYCVGFAIVGHDLEASIARMIGGENANADAREAHEFFDNYRVGTCDGSPHQH